MPEYQKLFSRTGGGVSSLLVDLGVTSRKPWGIIAPLEISKLQLAISTKLSDLAQKLDSGLVNLAHCFDQFGRRLLTRLIWSI